MGGDLAAPLAAILGHEGAGIVYDVGTGVTSVKPGDHVIPLWRLSCGECEYCTGGRPALCAVGTEIRGSGRLLDGTSRFSLDGRETKHFAGVGAVIIAAKVKQGSTVAVYGAGGIGVNVVQGAVLAGAATVIAVDRYASRLEQAKQFGATYLVNASDGNPAEAIRDLTGGKGVDYAFEAVGLPTTIRQAYDCLAKRGVAMIVGIPPAGTEVTVPSASLVYEERVLTGSLYGSAAPSSVVIF